MNIEWLAQDADTLAHTSKLTVAGKATVSPQAAQVAASQIVGPHHATTKREDSISPRSTLVVAGEMLTRQTLEAVGRSKLVTDGLMARMKGKMIPGRINLVYTRIPSGYQQDNGTRLAAPKIDDMRASALVDVQLEADATFIVPPLPSDLNDKSIFDLGLERTKVGIQTSDTKKEIVGYVPKTDHLEIVRDMVASYVKNDIRFFAVDFSGASNVPSLMRTVVRTVREKLKIKKKAPERGERYYLHVFNVASAKKSVHPVTPLSDIITHPYSVDSTSGVMWGGGKLEIPKLRYYNTADYGHYRKDGIIKKGTNCACATCSKYTLKELYTGTPIGVYERLRAHRIAAYGEECTRISDRIAAAQPQAGYWPYLTTKDQGRSEIEKVLHDVQEVRAAL